MLPLLIVSGCVVVTLVVLGIVWAASRALRRQREARLAALEQEGIVARSGPGWLTIVLRGYRAPGIRVGVSFSKTPGVLVVTKRGVHGIGVRLSRLQSSLDLGPEELGSWRAWLKDGLVHLATSSPPHATGEVELRAHGGEDLLAALRDHGVRIE